jgi:hypothetical protein
MLPGNSDDATLWKAIRNLQTHQGVQDKRLDALEAIEAERAGTRDWVFTRLIPVLCSLVIAYAALATLFHW